MFFRKLCLFYGKVRTLDCDIEWEERENKREVETIACWGTYTLAQLIKKCMAVVEQDEQVTWKMARVGKMRNAERINI
jgi:hypothetical protein